MRSNGPLPQVEKLSASSDSRLNEPGTDDLSLDSSSKRKRDDPLSSTEPPEVLVEEEVKVDGFTDQRLGEDDSLGPKGAQMPDDTIYPSDDIENILDVGDLPEGLRKPAWEMLRCRSLAFGFDGRLGHNKTKAQIRVASDQVPTACTCIIIHQPTRR